MAKANTLRRRAQLSRAMDLYKAALAEYNERGNGSTLDAAACKNNIALVLEKEGKLHEALEM